MEFLELDLLHTFEHFYLNSLRHHPYSGNSANALAATTSAIGKSFVYEITEAFDVRSIEKHDKANQLDHQNQLSNGCS